MIRSGKALRRSSRRGERGYALLLIIFLLTVLAITALAATPNLLTEGKREKEEEMIWRGKQYVRGVKLFYRKNNRFPTQLEDLYKPKMGSLRFMRQPYKDPMNKEDGSWRLIYVGPAGQLIGSLKPRQTNLQLPSPAGAQVGSSQAPAGATGGAQGTQPGQPGTQASGAPGGPAAGAGAANSAGQSGDAASGQPDLNNPQTAGPEESPTIIGGNIIGVGSKVNQRSFKIYDKAKNYRLFEFVWDPSKDTAAFGQPAMQTGTGLGTPAGGTPTGGQLGGTSSQPGPGNPNAPQPPQQPPTQGPPQNQ